MLITYAVLLMASITIPPTEEKLVIPEGGAFDFLTDVACDKTGSVFVVNAPFNDTNADGNNSITNAGAIYIGNRQRGIYQKVTPKETWREASAVFGHHVAVSPDGRVIVASARGQTYGVYSGGGMVYVLVETESGIYKIVRRFGARDPQTDGRFGFSVSVSNEIDTNIYCIAVGHPFYDAHGVNDEGEVEIIEFDISTHTVVRAGRLWETSFENGQMLGYSTKISEDGHTVISGLRQPDLLGQTLSGNVLLYNLSSGSTSWSNGTNYPTTHNSKDEIGPPTPFDNAYFGVSNSSSPTTFAYEPISISGKTVTDPVNGGLTYMYAIGAHGHDTNIGYVEIGYIDNVNQDFVQVKTYLGDEQHVAGVYFGSATAVSRDGDVLAIGVQEYDGGATNKGGMWFVVADGDPTQAASWPTQLGNPNTEFVTPNPGPAWSFFGYDLEFSDEHLWIVSSDYDTVLTDIGAVYIYRYKQADTTVSATNTEVQKPVNVQIEEMQLRVPGYPPFKKIP